MKDKYLVVYEPDAEEPGSIEEAREIIKEEISVDETFYVVKIVEIHKMGKPRIGITKVK